MTQEKPPLACGWVKAPEFWKMNSGLPGTEDAMRFQSSIPKRSGSKKKTTGRPEMVMYACDVSKLLYAYLRSLMICPVTSQPGVELQLPNAPASSMMAKTNAPFRLSASAFNVKAVAFGM